MSDDARVLITYLGEYPPGGRLIDQPFVDACRDFNGDDPVRFLRDLRDDLVWHGGCADAVISVITATLSMCEPESDQAAIERRELLAIKRLEAALQQAPQKGDT